MAEPSSVRGLRRPGLEKKMLALAAWSCRGEEGAVFRSWAGTDRCTPPARDLVGEINLLVSKSIAFSASEGTDAPGDQSSLN